ncbi:uncharacterized protein G2W53_019743 [Senna tora]|uniref:Knr4/Smi1-like domain-containing protein n=1 Tax=Senna tora TaxID=362788 RepID=A0A834TVI6_9FABA|nr:uncharacterized protein G2W53_019743 [Senna tora]
MATAIATGDGTCNPNVGARPKSKVPRARRICFSFAAYAKSLIESLRWSNIAVAEGLSDSEISSIESSFNFCFPPDLRSILQQGLPISPGFPNWRSSSAQQLQILLNLPVFSLLRRVSKNNFWHASWGPPPEAEAESEGRGGALDTARRFLRDVPILVPIYRHCYIASSPNLAGNPVFYVDHEGDVRVLSYDLSGFFREAEFLSENGEYWDEPVWAARTARRVEFWSDVAEAREGWWWRSCMKGELGGCLEEVYWRLREGGWKEEEIREMMMIKGGDEEECGPLKDREAIVGHVAVLSQRLLRAGWTKEDVVYSLGVTAGEGDEGKSRQHLHTIDFL